MSSGLISYTKFVESITTSGESLILWAVPCDDLSHPSTTDVSVVFIRGIQSKKTHMVCFGHNDDLHEVKKESLVSDFSKLKNRKWVFDKKSFIQMLPISHLNDIDLFLHLWEGDIIDKSKYETMAHKFITRSKRGIKNLNNAIPLLKHKEMFEGMCNAFDETKHPIDVGYEKENSIIIETLAEMESCGIYINPTCFKSHFSAQIYPNDLVYSQYHIYTSTGRPSNNFDNVNYAALNKDNGARKCFTSRFGEDGKIVLIDYSAFHPRIICHLTKFPLSIDIDIYKYLAEMYFKREVNEGDIEPAKKLTFRQLYGGVEEEYEHIKYFSRLKSFVDLNWKNFQRDGYVLTPMFKRRITDKHVLDPNPSKLFNYILQATETEIAIPAVKSVNQYLKNKKTKAVLYTYDSILFDFHKDDGGKVLNDIIKIMKMNDRFPIKAYMGDSYDSVSQIYPQLSAF